MTGPRCKFCYGPLETEAPDNAEWFCRECLDRKVKHARGKGDCRCGQIEGVHRHPEVPMLTASEIQQARVEKNLTTESDLSDG